MTQDNDSPNEGLASSSTVSADYIAREFSYRQLFECAPEPLLLLDGTRIVACNPVALTLFDRAEKHLVSADICDVAGSRQPDGRVAKEKAREKFASTSDARTRVFDWQFRRTDGSPLHVEVKLQSVPHHARPLQIAALRDITARVGAEKKLRSSEQELSSILNNMLDTYFQLDKQGRLVRVSPAVRPLLGFRPKDIVGTHVGEFYVDHFSRQRLLRSLEERGGTVQDYEIQLQRHDRERVWVSISLRRRMDRHGRLIGLEGTVRDISERKRAEQETRKLSSMLEHMADSVIVADGDAVIQYVNPAFTRATGYTRDDVLGRRRWLLHNEGYDEIYHEWAWKTIKAGHVFRDIITGRRKDGSLWYEDRTITPVKDPDGNITHFIATGKDITHRMQTQGRLQYPAHRDMLTELPNRALFSDRLGHAIVRKREDDGALAALVIDIDQFRTVNDKFGNDLGDQVLQALAERLNRCVREGDTIARIGGDEFAVILEHINSADHVAPIARKIQHILSRPLGVGGHELTVTTSVGISLYPNDGDTAEMLLKNAEVAMLRAKEHGQNNYKFHSSEAAAKAFERLSLEASLRRAITAQQFRLFFQPQVHVPSGRVLAMEALLRWEHPDLGLVSPIDFFPILEETNLIQALNEWVIHAACKQAREWRDAGYAPVVVAVNLTNSQASSPHLTQLVKKALEAVRLEPQWLELEVFESFITHNARTSIATLRALHHMGVRIAIDDFATGLTSLVQLRHLPINTIKIDRSFVGDLTRDPDDAAIVQAITAMAGPLKLRIVAEGVETAAQADFLRAHGCEVMQGHLFHPPRAAESCAQFLSRDTSPGVGPP